MSTIFVVGANGYIGRATVAELAARGHRVVCFVRPSATWRAPQNVEVRYGDVTDETSVRRDGARGDRFDAVVSCLSTRTGAPNEAWLVDDQANRHVLTACRDAGATHFVLLSAICVQKPLLAFQHAKLAFEKHLIESGMPYTIVRPTAFFKSLSGQIKSVQRGKPFLVFGDGELTACKPISESDLARFLADCLDDPSKRNAILPIGGPGPAITPRQQAMMLAELTGQPVRLRRVPVWMMDAIVVALNWLGRLSVRYRDKAELARIGRYYATESMLVCTERGYDAGATPSFGNDTLRDFYERVIREGLGGQELGEHAVFERPKVRMG